MPLLSLLPLFGLHMTWPKREEEVGEEICVSGQWEK